MSGEMVYSDIWEEIQVDTFYYPHCVYMRLCHIYTGIEVRGEGQSWYKLRKRLFEQLMEQLEDVQYRKEV